MQAEDTGEDDSQSDDEKLNNEYGASTITRQGSEKQGKAKGKEDEATPRGDEKTIKGGAINSQSIQLKNEKIDSKVSMVSSNKHDNEKKRISNQNAMGIRNIFKKIKENEENMKETYNLRKSTKKGNG